MVLRVVYNRYIEFFEAHSLRDSPFHTEDARKTAVLAFSLGLLFGIHNYGFMNLAHINWSI